MTLCSAKGHAALRRGRLSQPGAEYFLTICAADGPNGLATPLVAGAILHEAKAMAVDGTWTLRCVVVMPDHLHLAMMLGPRLPLEKTVQRLKAKTAAALRSGGLEWERGFFDRKLRPDDKRLPVFRYIYLNPYRAALLPESEKWPYYYCLEDDWLWFQQSLDEDLPYPEWLVM
jgi:REP element-mobilizing transposase RayT